MIAPRVPTHRPGAEVVAVADQGGGTQTPGVPGAVDLVRGHGPSLVLERHHHDESTIAPSPRPPIGVIGGPSDVADCTAVHDGSAIRPRMENLHASSGRGCQRNHTNGRFHRSVAMRLAAPRDGCDRQNRMHPIGLFGHWVGLV